MHSYRIDVSFCHNAKSCYVYKHAPGFSVRKKAVPLQSRKLALKDVGIKYSCSESFGIEMLLTSWCSSRNS